MAFVKLDCGLLRSSLWVERDHRSLFITALLMAVPYEVVEPMEQIEVRSLNPTGWMVPPGWYGMIGAAGVGIIRQDGMEQEAGLDALEVLGSPDPESRSQLYEGRRLVRVNGGYIALNFMEYRERDHTAAIRQQRFRERKKAQREAGKSNALRNDVTPSRDADNTVTSRNITQAEAEAEVVTTTSAKKRGPKPADPYFDELWSLYPKRAGGNPKDAAQQALHARIAEGVSLEVLEAGLARYRDFCKATGKIGTEYVMQAVRFFGPNKPYLEEWGAPVAAPTKKDAGIADAVAEASDLSGFTA